MENRLQEQVALLRDWLDREGPASPAPAVGVSGDLGFVHRHRHDQHLVENGGGGRSHAQGGAGEAGAQSQVDDRTVVPSVPPGPAIRVSPEPLIQERQAGIGCEGQSGSAAWPGVVVAHEVAQTSVEIAQNKNGARRGGLKSLASSEWSRAEYSERSRLGSRYTPAMVTPGTDQTTQWALDRP